MKIFHSIRWQLQLWHGLLLLLVLTGFGFTAWQLQEANQMRRIDHELEQRMGIISGPMKPHNVPASERQPLPGRLQLSAREQSLFDGMPGQVYYYIVWLRDGRQITASASAPPGVPRPERIPGPPSFRSRGTLRECFHNTQAGECVLVGREIREELAGIRRTAWLLAGAGGAVFIFGLVGGWWIVGRALHPIAAISATAAGIANGDLGRRIPTTDAESELGRLSRDLNNTFARLQGDFARQAQFTADASHELRTPVSVILTQTQSALLRERPPAEYRESLAICERAARRMRMLIESLLVLARIDSAEASPSLAPCDLSKIASESMELLRPLAAQKNIRVEGDFKTTPCMADAGQLAQVVSNVVANSIHYNRPDGSVLVSVFSEPEAAVLQVTDTGQGIPPDDLPNIFDRFHRVDKSRTGPEPHSGLGLAISKAIVEAHGGSIQVESTPGTGSSFVVRLPVASASPQQ